MRALIREYVRNRSVVELDGLHEYLRRKGIEVKKNVLAVILKSMGFVRESKDVYIVPERIIERDSRITVRLDSEIRRKISEIAEREGKSMSEIVREAIQRYLEMRR